MKTIQKLTANADCIDTSVCNLILIVIKRATNYMFICFLCYYNAVKHDSETKRHVMQKGKNSSQKPIPLHSDNVKSNLLSESIRPRQIQANNRLIRKNTNRIKSAHFQTLPARDVCNIPKCTSTRYHTSLIQQHTH